MVSREKWPTFQDSMQFSYKYKNEKQNIEDWKSIEDRYLQIKKKPLSKEKIPKIIHQIWLGKQMPEFEKKLSDQVKNNLDTSWQYILWTEENIQDLQTFKNKNLFDATPNRGQKSDLLRYAILNEFGGIYMDTDFLMVGAFNSLLDLDFFCGVSFDEKPNLFNGLIGSSSNNPIIKELLNLDRPLQFHDAMLLMDSTGPFFLTRKFLQLLSNCLDAVALPNSFFYPYPNFDQCKTLGTNYKDYIKTETICCHMWSSAWM
jgi:mannosyltransferase OCH1-like enzyme